MKYLALKNERKLHLSETEWPESEAICIRELLDYRLHGRPPVREVIDWRSGSKVTEKETFTEFSRRSFFENGQLEDWEGTVL